MDTWNNVGFLYLILDSTLGAGLRALKVLPEPLPTLIFSAALAFIFVSLYGLISPQQKIKKSKNKIWANIFEATLFQKDIKIAFQAYARLCLAAVQYLSLAIGPIVVLLIPSLVLLSFGFTNLGQRAYEPGEKFYVKAQVSENARLKDISLEAQNLTGFVRTNKSREITGAVSKTEGLQDAIHLKQGNVILGTIQTLSTTTKESPTSLKDSPHLLDLLFGTNRILLSQNPLLRSLEISYPEKELFGLSWTVFSVIAILLIGYIFAKFLKIEV